MTTEIETDPAPEGYSAGPWLTAWPDEIPPGSVWEWETQDKNGWDEKQCSGPRCLFISRGDGLYPMSFKWDVDVFGLWNITDFRSDDRIRRLYPL